MPEAAVVGAPAPLRTAGGGVTVVVVVVVVVTVAPGADVLTVAAWTAAGLVSTVPGGATLGASAPALVPAFFIDCTAMRCSSSWQPSTRRWCSFWFISIDFIGIWIQTTAPDRSTRRMAPVVVSSGTIT